jgi:Peptidase family M1 domain
MTAVRGPVIGLVFLLSAMPGMVSAQLSAEVAASNTSVAAYDRRYEELRSLKPVPEKVASVRRLVLQRDVGQFTLEDGSLYLLSSVGARVVGAVFVGKGTFSFAPPSRMEQERLTFFEKTKALVTPLNAVAFFFADTTVAELERNLTFGSARVPDDVGGTIADALGYLRDEDSRSFDPDLMEAFLNQDSTDFFYAHIRRPGGEPLMFTLNPRLNEAVQLATRARRRGWMGKEVEVISQFPRRGDTLPASTYRRRPHAGVRHYAIDTRLEHTSMGDVRFSATTRLLIAAEAPVGPWVPFWLFSKLDVDSARWDEGSPAVVVKPKDSPVLWVNLGRRLRPGETKGLTLFYRGDLIDRYGDWFFIKTSAAWYPIPLDGRSLATFDLTYRVPSSLVLASVGERIDSTAENRTVKTRWVTKTPVAFAAFNVGRFKVHHIREEGAPPITVLASDDAHKAFSRELLRRGVAGAGPQRKMKEVVGSDVLNSMKFFQHVFGPAIAGHFYATEVPYFHGLAFPGLVHLSWTTFRDTQDDGFDEFFRAHEVAHQWWGLGVDYTTYHEQWLSEGFASFAGLWYLQTSRKDNRKYFDMLGRWRADIMSRRNDPAPVWLGWRNRSGLDEAGYGVIVYHKGAWVLHMLRIMLLELKTMNEDRFTEMMRDFYQTYQGKRATTEDFRRIAEKHVGADLGWFFDQWIYGRDIPTYRVVYWSEPAEGGQFRVKLQVLQENVPESFQAYVPVTMDLGQDRIARLRVKVLGAKTDIELPLMPARPKSLRFNDLDGVLAEVKSVEER